MVHNYAVEIAGAPSIAIDINGETEQATYLSGTGTRFLVFRYTVKAGDEDLNGIEISNLIELNDGSMTYALDGVMTNTTLEIDPPSQTNYRVDTVSLKITQINLPNNGYYQQGDELNISLQFNEELNINGSSYLELIIDGSVRNFTLAGENDGLMTYSYTVPLLIVDLDGLEFSEEEIVLSSGSIVDLAGNTAHLDFSSLGANLSNVFIDTQAPTITIASALDINQSNENNYTLTGNCSENRRSVSVSIGSLNFSTSCSAGTWNTGTLDVSATADDATLNISVTQSDLASNSTTVTTTVSKDTTLPTVTIDTYSNIDQVNVSTYSLAGTCSENGQSGDIQISSYSANTTCASNTWSLSSIDLTSLAESDHNILADHQSASLVSAPQASITITKDTSAPTVTISRAPNINSQNEASYSMSGTCSENGRNVAISIGSLTTLVTCTSGTWLLNNYNTTSLVDNSALTVTADHNNAALDDAVQATRVISKDTNGPSITSLNTIENLANSIGLSWSIINPSSDTIDDYIVQYRLQGNSTWLSFYDGMSTNNQTTVTGLNPSSNYEFRVEIEFNSSSTSAFSQITIGSTQPDDPLFSSEFIYINLGGATTTNVAAINDNTRVYLNDIEIPESPLSDGEVVTLNSTARFDKLEGDGPLYAAGNINNGANNPEDKGNVMWSPNSWAGRDFSFNATRNDPQVVHIYAIEEASVIAREGTNFLDSASLEAGESTTLTWNNFGSFQINSTGTIIAFSNSGGIGHYYDVKPLLPASRELIGFPSSNMTLTASLNGTNYTYIHSNSNSKSDTINKSDAIVLSPQGTSSLYQSLSLLISADQNIAGASYADSNGYCASPFLPTSMMKKNYVINTDADYIAFTSKETGTISVDAPVQTLTLSRSDANSNAPFRARFANQTSGYRYISDVDMVGWYQPNNDVGAADQDETILVGY